MHGRGIMNRLVCFALCLGALAVAGCASGPSSTQTDYTPAASVTRAEALRIAESYRTHRWRATDANDFSELRAGDLVNKENVHALLFVEFVDAVKTKFIAYETGSPPTWKVLRHPISVRYVEELGYRPYRYRGMHD